MNSRGEKYFAKIYKWNFTFVGHRLTVIKKYYTTISRSNIFQNLLFRLCPVFLTQPGPLARDPA